jgi:hypothetical protein
MCVCACVRVYARVYARACARAYVTLTPGGPYSSTPEGDPSSLDLLKISGCCSGYNTSSLISRIYADKTQGKDNPGDEAEHRRGVWVSAQMVVSLEEIGGEGRRGGRQVCWSRTWLGVGQQGWALAGVEREAAAREVRRGDEHKRTGATTVAWKVGRGRGLGDGNGNCDEGWGLGWRWG